MALVDRTPSYLPAGYRFRSTLRGQAAGGFAGTEEQVTHIYTRGAERDDFTNRLAVHLGTTDGPLFGTEGHPGRPIELALDAALATYHDGMWMLGPGPDERQVGEILLHWDTSVAHSISVRFPRFSIAVRGARGRGVDLGELLRVSRSLG
jgi:hypothetical protein